MESEFDDGLETVTLRVTKPVAEFVAAEGNTAAADVLAAALTREVASGRLVRLPRRRAGLLHTAVALLRTLLGLGETPAARRARLDRKAAVERAAKERL
jgi:hypothetical protein